MVVRLDLINYIFPSKKHILNLTVVEEVLILLISIPKIHLNTY